MHDARVGGELLQLPSHAVVEAHAHRQKQVRAVNGVVGHHRAVHAKHVEAHGVASWEGAQAHESGGHWDTGELDKLAQLVRRVQHATTHVQLGPLRGLHDVDDLLQHGLAWQHRRQAADVASQLHVDVPVGHRELLLNVLGHVYEHGTRAARVGEEERLAHDARQVIQVGHQVVVLGDLARDFHNGSLLKCVCANHRPGHLPSDGHHGNRVQKRVCQASHQVGGAGTRGGNAHGGFTRHLSVSLRGKHLALLVAAENVSNGAGPGEGLVDLHARAARVRKHQVHSLALERLHQHVTSLARLVVLESRHKVLGNRRLEQTLP
mmetsp:Transcript_15919/g.30675  ORF Transcript_15919/g.30675 Transcript_15919/m.30675 type:complete len:321 (+) Transcript_15919:1255-2217(+)